MSEPGPYGLAALPDALPLPRESFHLILRGIAALWERIVGADPGANARPLLLSYDVHLTPAGPVLIEVNTNAGGILTAIQAARFGNDCCADWEQGELEDRLLALFRRDLLDVTPEATGVVGIVDDQLDAQPLRAEMAALARLIRPFAREARLVDASELRFAAGRLWHRDLPIDRVYWRSTDFLLHEPLHRPVRQALDAGAIVLAPSPEAYRAIADKRRFIDWSRQPVLAAGQVQDFRIAETHPLSARPLEDWYAERARWVFKPACGHASRGVYVGKRISRRKLAALPADRYLAQRHAAHPVTTRDGEGWKYDLRLFADRGRVIGATARIFQGQVVGMRAPGSGFAPIRVERACCLVGALGAATLEMPRPAQSS